jgi:HSF-type DNA-binding
MDQDNAKSRAEFEGLFPAKLHYVLEQVEKDGGRDVIAWRSHGRAFLVKDREKFVKDLLPKYVARDEQHALLARDAPSRKNPSPASSFCDLPFAGDALHS